MSFYKPPLHAVDLLLDCCELFVHILAQMEKRQEETSKKNTNYNHEENLDKGTTIRAKFWLA